MSNHIAEVVTLEPNALYIGINALLMEGKFHWSLWFTDGTGISTRHEWAEMVPSKRQKGGLIEEYTALVVHPVPVYTAENHLMLAFFKIGGYVPPEGTSLDFVPSFSAIFPKSYNDVRANRSAGVNCRTWAMKALALLQARGQIVRSDPVESLEETIIQHGIQLENLIARHAEDTEWIFTSQIIAL